MNKFHQKGRKGNGDSNHEFIIMQTTAADTDFPAYLQICGFDSCVIQYILNLPLIEVRESNRSHQALVHSFLQFLECI